MHDEPKEFGDIITADHKVILNKAFASFDLEMIQPSLLDKTTTGFLLIFGLNNRSQET